jgi:hypothetical protein
MEPEELIRVAGLQKLPQGYVRLTFNVPSSVQATTTRLSTSLAMPMIERSFLLLPNPRLATSDGGGGMLNDLRRMPDCMFHMWIIPVEDPAIPKFPHALTQTAWTVNGRKRIISQTRQTILQRLTFTDQDCSLSAVPNVHRPTFLFKTDHVRAIDSSTWAVMTSSQSLDLADENAREVTAGNFRFMTGMESEVAFFVSAPRLGRSVLSKALHTLDATRALR